MREIKFRAWNIKKEIMENKSALAFSSDGVILYDYEQLMQFTGLKDKNGVEIYEGDILKKGTYSVLVMYSEYHTSFQVYFKEDNPSITSLYEFGYSDEIEVIGNIYENRELLND